MSFRCSLKVSGHRRRLLWIYELCECADFFRRIFPVVELYGSKNCFAYCMYGEYGGAVNRCVAGVGGLLVGALFSLRMNGTHTQAYECECAWEGISAYNIYCVLFSEVRVVNACGVRIIICWFWHIKRSARRWLDKWGGGSHNHSDVQLCFCGWRLPMCWLPIMLAQSVHSVCTMCGMF